MCSYFNKVICVLLEEINCSFASGQGIDSCHVPVHGQERHTDVQLSTRCLGGIISPNVRCPSRTGHWDLSWPPWASFLACRKKWAPSGCDLSDLSWTNILGWVTSWSHLLISVASIIALGAISSNLHIQFGALWVRGDISCSLSEGLGSPEQRRGGEVAQAQHLVLLVPVPGFAFFQMPSLSSWLRCPHCVGKLLPCE